MTIDQTRRDSGAVCINTRISLVNIDIFSQTYSMYFSINGNYSVAIQYWVCLLYTSPSPRDRG